MKEIKQKSERFRFQRLNHAIADEVLAEIGKSKSQDPFLNMEAQEIVNHAKEMLNEEINSIQGFIKKEKSHIFSSFFDGKPLPSFPARVVQKLNETLQD